MDALELLANDHRVMQDKISEYERTTAVGDRRDLVDTVVDELTRHTVVEKHMLYPLLARVADPIDESPSLHLDMHDKLILALTALTHNVKYDRGNTDDLIATLHLDLAFHTNIEEEHVHPQLRQALDQPALDELGRIFEDAKGVLRDPADPRVSADQSTNLAIATATFCDRLRDRLGDQAPV